MTGAKVTRVADPVELSVVVPVYGCRECLATLHERLTASLASVTPSYELLFVDDRSPDGAWTTLSDIADGDPAVRGIRLSRNFGQQAAITAGLAESRGRWTVVMDCDLQDPPELIPQLYSKAQEGFDIVLARRTQRNHSLPRLLAARVYFAFIRIFLGIKISGEYGAFSIISQKVRDAFLTIPDKDRHYMPILFWLGFERTDLEFEHANRYAGKSAYSAGALFRLAAEGVFFQTTTLLRWIIYSGFFIALLGMLWAAYIIISYFLLTPLPGWTSLAILILLIGGFIITSTGVAGLYIGKIFKQVKDRPLYIVDSEIRREPIEALRAEPARRLEASDTTRETERVSR
jgi:polyisoprenyl-phosphate glycosyltransferase